jgi:serine/threonine-protein kinase RsbW
MPDSYILAEQRWNSIPFNVQLARELARSILQRYAADCADLIELAIGEACANAIEHGSPSGADNSFTLRCSLVQQESALVFEVEDEGREFALTNLTLSHAPDLYAEHGRGLFLINQIMDEVTLRSMPSGLNIRMVKCLPLHEAMGSASKQTHACPR